MIIWLLRGVGASTLKTIADTATGADAVTVGAIVRLSDAGSVSDAIAGLQALLSAIDAGGGTDIALTITDSRIAYMRFTLSARSAKTTLSARSAKTTLHT